MLSPSVVRQRLLLRDLEPPKKPGFERKGEFLRDVAAKGADFAAGTTVLVRENTVPDEACRMIVSYTLFDPKRDLAVDVSPRTMEDWAMDKDFKFSG